MSLSSRIAALAVVALISATAQAQQSATKGAAMKPAPVVFIDFAGKPAAKLHDFYSNLFGWTISADGRFTAHVVSPPLIARSDYQGAYGSYATTISAPLAGQMRTDPSERRVYLGVSDIAATLKGIKAQGGTVEAERFEVPGVVVLGMFRDPAGNAMGLIEMDGDRVKIP
jgi:uncharacterized protein